MPQKLPSLQRGAQMCSWSGTRASQTEIQTNVQKIQLAFFQFVLLSRKQVLMDHSPFPLPHLPAVTTLTQELKAGLN